MSGGQNFLFSVFRLLAWIAAVHGMIWEPLELFCFHKQFGISTVFKRFQPFDALQFFTRRWIHGSGYDSCSLVLNLANLIKVRIGYSTPCCHSVFKHWSDSSGLHLIKTPTSAARVVSASYFVCASLFPSGFWFLRLLLTGHPLVKGDPKVNRIILLWQSFFIDDKSSCWIARGETEDYVSGLSWVNFHKPHFRPFLKYPQRFLNFIGGCWDVFFWAPDSISLNVILEQKQTLNLQITQSSCPFNRSFDEQNILHDLIIRLIANSNKSYLKIICIRK